MSAGSLSLGRTEILRLQNDGWIFFSGGAVRVGNGWLLLALDPRGNYTVQIIADPNDEPEKWADDSGPKCEGAQLALL
jgi:hypothetical protein